MNALSASAPKMPLNTILCVYARDIFRNQADFDYIAARSNFRLHLRQQFLWSSQQAIEKYLKAILLFNGISARFYKDKNQKEKEFSHKLDKLLESVKSISDINFTLKPSDAEFIAFLADEGVNRYVSTTAHSSFDALKRLDSVVWHIRRYCQSFEPSSSIPQQLHSIAKRESLDRALDQKYENQPHTFKLQPGESGALEKILEKSRNHPARPPLVWANSFFGARKRAPAKYATFSSFEIPPKERGWENVDWTEVDKYVKPLPAPDPTSSGARRHSIQQGSTAPR